MTDYDWEMQERKFENDMAAIDLEVENAQLRELVMLDWEWAHTCCGNGCRLNTEHCGYAADRECNFEREIYDRMRELGIEVD